MYDLFPRLGDRRRQLAGTMSGGERQMLALGRALVADPKVLLLDEPSLGLAPRVTRDVFRTLVELRSSGVSILLVKQNARAALQVADYAYVLELGTVTIEGQANPIAQDRPAGLASRTFLKNLNREGSMRFRFCFLMMAAAALAVTGTSPTAQAQVKVGLTISGSGPGAALGLPQMKSVAALPKEIAGLPITYIPLDDESDPAKAAQNSRKLLVENNVDLLIGSSVTPATLPLLEMALENKTPLITLAAAAALVQPLDDKRRWVFKVVPNDDLMARVIIKRIAQTGVKQLGYIGVSDGYGEGYYKELAKLAPDYGITLTTHEVYGRGDSSALGQTLKVIATNPDAVFIASAGTPAVLPQKSLRERGHQGRIYQTHGVATEEFIKLGGKDVEGAVFAGEAFTIAEDLAANDPFKAPNVEYVAAYRAATQQAANLFGAHLWDAVALLKQALPGALKSAAPGTAEFRIALRNKLEQGNGIYLNNGFSTITPTDHNGYDERSTFLIKIDNGRFHLFKP